MAKHLPCSTWALRLEAMSPYVRTSDKYTIGIVQPNYDGGNIIELTRRDARLLAKRINQCLDGTK